MQHRPRSDRPRAMTPPDPICGLPDAVKGMYTLAKIGAGVLVAVVIAVALWGFR